MMEIAEVIVLSLGIWFGVGTIFALLFVIFGVHRIDAAAKGAGPFFRPAIFLGCTILWPFVIIRWLSGIKVNQPNKDAS